MSNRGDIMGIPVKAFSLRIDDKMLTKLKVLAREHKRSLNKEIELFLQLQLDAYEQEHGEIQIPDSFES